MFICKHLPPSVTPMLKLSGITIKQSEVAIMPYQTVVSLHKDWRSTCCGNRKTHTLHVLITAPPGYRGPPFGTTGKLIQLRCRADDLLPVLRRTTLRPCARFRIYRFVRRSLCIRDVKTQARNSKSGGDSGFFCGALIYADSCSTILPFLGQIQQLRPASDAARGRFSCQVRNGREHNSGRP